MRKIKKIEAEGNAECITEERPDGGKAENVREDKGLGRN